MKEILQAIIKNGIVDSVIVASDNFANSLPETTVNITDIPNVGSGWKHNKDGTFSHPDTLLSVEDLLIKKTAEEKAWRDSELSTTDKLSQLSDYPKLTEILAYRKLLRDYPLSLDFPNGDRPINI